MELRLLSAHMYIIYNNELLVHKGAIDSDPRGNNKEVENYMDLALMKLVEGNNIIISGTKPYGCSAKI